MECRELFQKIDELNEQYLTVWEEICNIESPTDCKEGVDAVGSYFIAMARARGWKAEIFRQDISGDAVCITLNPDADAAPITLSGHLDTVHPLGSFGTPAVHRDDTNLYGPGVMDCKGGVVAAFLAMESLDTVGFRRRPVQLILQSDEENSSITSNKTTIDYMCRKGAGSVAFLNLEGHQKGTAVLMRKGILRYKFTIKGKALHSARCTEGANAIAEAAWKIIELEKMKDPDGLTCNCGIIQGGTKANTVAECCTFTADIRFITEAELENAKKKIQTIADTTTVAGCTCTVEEVSYRPAMQESEKNTALLSTLNQIYARNGLPVLKGRMCLSGSDAAYVTQQGTPCIDSLGVEGQNIHTPDEQAVLASLAESAKRIAAAAYCIL